MININNIIIGSHNSMSYLKPINFLGRLIRWTSQCQTLSLGEQLLHGVKAFDLRVRFNRKGEPILCHGLVDYHNNLNDILYQLNKQCKTLYVRLVLETFLLSPSNKDVRRFEKLCDYVKHNYPNLQFQFIQKHGWKIIETNFTPPVEELFHSPSTLLEVLQGPKRLLHYQDDNLKQHSSPSKPTIYLLDFVETLK